MAIATGTLEGESGSCPICDAFAALGPSRPPGNAVCPRCGHLIWLPSAASQMMTCLLDRPVVAENIDHAESAQLLEDALVGISEPAAEILRHYYIEGLTFEAIGRKFAMSRTSVRRAWAQGLKELRPYFDHPG